MSVKDTTSKSAAATTAKKKPTASVKKVSVKKSAAKVATKPKAAKKTTRRAKKKTISDAEARYNRIAEIAYLKAEQRGFEHGSAVDDWLEAEREVDAISDAINK